MALDPLATAADLDARGITEPSGLDADAFLASASAAIRDAAGCPISATTSTVDLVAPANTEQWLELPGGPVTEVATVLIAGAAVTDYTLIGNALWRADGWLSPDTTPPYAPTVVTVTMTHGLATVPADLVDLTCSLTAMAMAQSGTSYGSQSKVASIKLGTAAKTFTNTEHVSPSPVALPDAVAARLRSRFGTAAGVIGFRQ